MEGGNESNQLNHLDGWMKPHGFNSGLVLTQDNNVFYFYFFVFF